MNPYLALGLIAAWSLCVDVAQAVTLTNKDPAATRILICDANCGPTDACDQNCEPTEGGIWKVTYDVWLGPGETKSFTCVGECRVGVFQGDPEGTLEDMVYMLADEIFRDDEIGFIRAGRATHHAQ